MTFEAGLQFSHDVERPPARADADISADIADEEVEVRCRHGFAGVDRYRMAVRLQTCFDGNLVGFFRPTRRFLASRGASRNFRVVAFGLTAPR